MLRLPDKVMTLPDVVRGRRSRPCARGQVADAGSLAGSRPRRRDGADPQTAARGCRRTGRRMTAAEKGAVQRPVAVRATTRCTAPPRPGSPGYCSNCLALGDIRRFSSRRPSSIPNSGAPSSAASRPAKMRIAAIRRHGRRPATPRWRWFVAHSEPGSEALYGGEVSDPGEYLELALDGSDGSPSDRSRRGDLCTWQARSVLCSAGPQRLQGDRGAVPRIHLGVFASGW